MLLLPTVTLMSLLPTTNRVTCLLAGSPIARYLTTFCPYIRARPCSVQLTSPTLLLSSWMSQRECRVESERLLTVWQGGKGVLELTDDNNPTKQLLDPSVDRLKWSLATV